ncbi:c-type cytochrome domain-containing protein [Croceivirga sp. JEA036]|uniref:c-type cytochrome domain-containing protein n=1 Tax=Croceivirga sp. JEA036 TaxID=2721162 RepID=UPI00143CA48E|nr:c-type cytochrome domain-containing protein [Croceivirga sp. JEA036]NJB35226.1 hypothetical protein [Croceivirga sp. JEA036]
MQEVSDFVLFLGRFHPLVVHLPIGFLLFALILEVTERFTKNKALSAAVPIALLAGTLSALMACVLGYMLSLSGDYDQDMLNGHLWFGVFTTLVAFFAWLVKTNKLPVKALQKAKPNMALLTVMVVLLSVTGHYGGNLTHGEEYLVKYAPFRVKEEPLPELAKLEDASVYPYLVQPVFEAKCVSCHNASKKKGGLAMHTFDALQTGGEGGPVLVAGNLEQSELFKRISLPEHHDDFMPPEGKTPLTEEEMTLVKFWIESGQGNQEATLGSVEVPEEVMQIAERKLGFAAEGAEGHGGTESLPTAAPFALEKLNELKVKGFGVRELVDGSGMLEITLEDHTITPANVAAWEKDFTLLTDIGTNILWLDLGGNTLSDAMIQGIAQFKNIRKLVLDNTSITDAQVQQLATLKQLQSLNIYNTNVSNKVLPSLVQMPQLKKVYVWRTSITPEALTALDVESTLEVITGA